MNSLARNFPLLHIFAVFGVCTWVFAGGDGGMIAPFIPWLVLFTVEAMLFPQCRQDETYPDARARAWGGLVKDPLFYAVAALCVYLAIPFFNTSLCWICDADKLPPAYPGMDVDYANPACSWLPFCMHADMHFEVFTWFAPPLLGALAAKHALRSEGKRHLLELMCWNGAALAVFGFIQAQTDAAAPFWFKPLAPYTATDAASYPHRPFSVFSYPNAGATFFAMLFAVSCGIWQSKYAFIKALPSHREFEHVKPPSYPFLRSHYMIAAAVLNFLGSLHTGSRAGWYSSIFLGVTMAIHVFAGYFQKADRLGKIRTAATALGLAAAASLAVAVFAPSEDGEETEDLRHRKAERVSGAEKAHKDVMETSAVSFFDRITGRVPSIATRVAWKLVKDHPWCGTGGWGFVDNGTWMVTPYARGRWSELDDDAWEKLCRDWLHENNGECSVGGANVHNDYLQFLAEHGIFGILLLAAVFLLLARPAFSEWRARLKAIKFSKGAETPAHPFVLYVMPTPVYGVMLGTAAIMIHAMADCPLRCGANTSLIFLSWACIGGFLFEDRR